LAARLREDLGQLVSRVESHGYRAQAWIPGQNEPIRADLPSSSRSLTSEWERQDPGGEQPSGQQQQARDEDAGRREGSRERQPAGWSEGEMPQEVASWLRAFQR
jgi:hypothetical protein